MPTTTNKQRQLHQIFTVLKKRYDPADPKELPVLEQFIFALCHEGTTGAQADRAYKTLCERFFDWNEIRVSSIREIEEAIQHLPHAEAKAQRLINFLQEVFETTYSFELESLHKKGFKQAEKQMGRFQAATDYVSAWVIQHSLGGHALALDGPTLRTLRRLGLVDEDQDDLEAIRASLEHLIPKIRGPLFVELMSSLAEEFCQEDEPLCPTCPMQSECPTGQETRRPVAASTRGGRTKPR